MANPLGQPLRLFGRAGASSIEEPHSPQALKLALRLGATGVQGDVWSTSDGQAVLSVEGHIGSRLRRKHIRDISLAEIGSKLTSVESLLGDISSQVDGFGPATEVMLTFRDSDSVASTMDTVISSGLSDRVWLMSTDVEQLAELGSANPLIRTIHSAHLESLPRGPEHHAALLRKLGIDAVSMSFDEWSAGHVALFHRFTRVTYAWGPVHVRQMVEVLGMDIDGMISPHVDRMIDSLNPDRPTP